MASPAIDLTKEHDETTTFEVGNPSSVLVESTAVGEGSFAEDVWPLSLPQIRMCQPKVLVTDLDSTLWDPNGICPETNKQISEQLVNKRVPQIICTGRSLEGAKTGLTTYGVSTLSPFPGVYSDGAIVYGDSQEDVISCTPLPMESVKELSALVIELDPSCHVSYVLKHCHMTAFKGFSDIFSAWNDTILEKSGLPDEDCLAMCVFSAEYNNIYEVITERMPEYQCFASEEFSLVLVRSKGVSKLTGLAKLMERYGYKDSEVVVIGDGINDIEMLGGMPLSIVMKDGHPMALAAGKCVTDIPSFEGGWGHAMKQIFL